MSEATWKARLGQIGCVLCAKFGLAQRGRTYLHHVREGQGKGQKSSDYMAVVLCHEHHQGASGWHGLGKMAFYTRYRADELDLLAWTLRAMDGG